MDLSQSNSGLVKCIFLLKSENCRYHTEELMYLASCNKNYISKIISIWVLNAKYIDTCNQINRGKTNHVI